MFNAPMMSAPSLSDIAAVTNGNDGFGGNNGWWILIILFAIFGGWGGRGYGGYGYGGGEMGAADNYVLASDFANLSRQVDSATSTIEGKLDSVNNGICSLGYDQLGQINGINTNISNAQYGLTTQLNALASQEAACCCQTQNMLTQSFADLNYNLATQSCQTRQAVADAQNAIMQNDNANYRAIDARLTAMEMSAKDDRIAELQAQLNAANLAASQAAQNNYIVSQLRPAPVPAYTVANPYAYSGGCGYCGCNA